MTSDLGKIKDINLDTEGTKEKLKYDALMNIPDIHILDGASLEKMNEVFRMIHDRVVENMYVPTSFILDSIPRSEITDEERAKLNALVDKLKELPKFSKEERYAAFDELTREEPTEIKHLEKFIINSPLPHGLDISLLKGRPLKMNEDKNTVNGTSITIDMSPYTNGKGLPDAEENNKESQKFDQMIQSFVDTRKAHKDNSEHDKAYSLKVEANKLYGDSIPDYDTLQMNAFINQNHIYGSASIIDSLEHARKLELHSMYGEHRPPVLKKVTGFPMDHDVIALAKFDTPDKINRASNIILKKGEEYLWIKCRGRLSYIVDISGYTTITPTDVRNMSVEGFEHKNFIIDISIKADDIIVQSKLMKELDAFNKTRRYRISSTVDRLNASRKYTIEETDELCKVLDCIFDKKIIEEFPESFSDNAYFTYGEKTHSMSILLDLRWEYIYNAGYGVITKPFADNLATYLKGKKCLEIMAGKAVISKALRDRGIDIIATDNFSWHDKRITNDTWTEVENIEAGDAIRKYNDVDVIIASWMPLDVRGKRLARMIRKYNPNVQIISIEEDCTANETWYDRVEYIDDNMFADVYTSYKSWFGVHDRPMLCEISKPWKK